MLLISHHDAPLRRDALLVLRQAHPSGFAFPARAHPRVAASVPVHPYTPRIEGAPYTIPVRKSRAVVRFCFARWAPTHQKPPVARLLARQLRRARMQSASGRVRAKSDACQGGCPPLPQRALPARKRAPPNTVLQGRAFPHHHRKEINP